MESYIVRIYRQKPKSEKMTGMVLKVGENAEHLFSNIFELYSILNNTQIKESRLLDKRDSKS